MSIQDRLLVNGNIIRTYQIKGQSISLGHRMVILNARSAALKSGYSWANVCDVEMLGLLGETVSARSVDADFAYEDIGALGIKKRMYNVTGIHVNRESTLDCMDLLRKGIVPSDMCLVELFYHAFLVGIANTYARIDVFLYDTMAALKRFVSKLPRWGK